MVSCGHHTSDIFLSDQTFNVNLYYYDFIVFNGRNSSLLYITLSVQYLLGFETPGRGVLYQEGDPRDEG